MKKYIIMTIFCAVAVAALAQKPHYLPGEGVYIVGLPADLSQTYDYPVMVTEAYKATFKTFGAELASAAAGGKSYNLGKYMQDDGTLNLVGFMGCGQASNLIVRNYDGDSYTIGDYAPNKTWNKTYLVAAFPGWDGMEQYTLGVYDHWDCPVTYEADTELTIKKAKAVSVDFGNPHEGLVCQGVNFNLISDDAELPSKANALTVSVKIFDDNRESVQSTKKIQLKSSNINKVGTTDDGKNIYAVYVAIYPQIVIAQPFCVEVDGFDRLGVDAWMPRAVDTHNLYPTHTTYTFTSSKEQIAESDACINIEGYFNYVGTWGWPNGKCEYGECVAQGDYVQVYIDPSDPDWPGMYYTGDPTFPVECAFGASDLMVYEKPDWINTIQFDTSQWEEYGALLLILQADALPTGETGRYAKVVISTSDEASFYTIHIRQGNGSFPTSVNGVKVKLSSDGGMFDLSGRRITVPQPGQMYVKDGKKMVK